MSLSDGHFSNHTIGRPPVPASLLCTALPQCCLTDFNYHQPLSVSLTCDASTVTDLCNDSDPGEVEIFSLVQEHIPLYRLRTDPLVNFTGYSNSDWGDKKVSGTEVTFNLTNEQISESLKYFLLCSERVSLMTRMYDIDAVTRLLEERDHDLELAASIGQSLLLKNQQLTSRETSLDGQLFLANEQMNQLRHELSVKNDLLHFYDQNLEQQSPVDSFPVDGSVGLNQVAVSLLQSKLSNLEEDNCELRRQSASLLTDTETYEDWERRLVEDCCHQLGCTCAADSSAQFTAFAEEVQVKTETCFRQKEEIDRLSNQVDGLRRRVRQLAIENMDWSEKDDASRDSQMQLTMKLSSQHDRYQELVELMENVMSELRSYRSNDSLMSALCFYSDSDMSVSGVESLASELEISLQGEMRLRRGRGGSEWKVFETVRAACSHDASVVSLKSSMGASSAGSLFSEKDSFGRLSDESVCRGDVCHGEVDSACWCGHSHSSHTDYSDLGISAHADPRGTLKRLAPPLVDAFNGEDHRLAHLISTDMPHSEQREVTVSEGSKTSSADRPTSLLGAPSYLSHQRSHLPRRPAILDRLQIVKPMDGSATLHHWQRLSQPRFGGGALIGQQDGVKFRCEHSLAGDVDQLQCSAISRAGSCSTVHTLTDSLLTRSTDITTSSCSVDVSAGISSLSSNLAMKNTGRITSRTDKGLNGLAGILTGRVVTGSTALIQGPISSAPQSVLFRSSVCALGVITLGTSSVSTVKSVISPLLTSPETTSLPADRQVISKGCCLLQSNPEFGALSKECERSADQSRDELHSVENDVHCADTKGGVFEISSIETGGILSTISTLRRNKVL